MVQKTAVCLTPMTPPITSIFGSERAGPAKSSASYKKGGNQTGQHMLPRIFLEHHKGLEP
jgi:hypothetical protein